VVGQSGDRLKSGQLGTADVTASTVANIGPGIDFYFGFGVIAVTAGVAAPAGVHGGDALLATLAYRLASYWLPLCAGPPAYLLYRHRYGPRYTSPGTIHAAQR
jgi:hypothetical protein